MCNKESRGKYDGLIVNELKYNPPMSEEFRAVYENFAKRILWIDDKLVPGSFQMNTSWYKTTPERDPIFEEHAHPSAEIIGFFGTDPENPYELPADIQLDIDGEPHYIRSSTLIFVPPNVPHNLRIHEIRKPIFHFSVVTEGSYNGSAYVMEEE